MIKNISKNLIALAIIIAGALIAGAVVFVNQQKTVPQEIFSLEQVGEKTINFINENLLSEGMTASLVSITEESGIYKIRLKIENQEYTSYITKDGKILFPQEGINLDEEFPVSEEPVPEEPVPEEPVPEEPVSGEPSEPTAPPTQTTIPEEKLTEFIACLKERDFVIYGANWCGWTKQLVETMGGWAMVSPVYVECTEKETLCREKNIRGYPTILIQGKQYQGARTFKGFSGATGCQMPEGAEFLNEDPPAGGC